MTDTRVPQPVSDPSDGRTVSEAVLFEIRRVSATTDLSGGSTATPSRDRGDHAGRPWRDGGADSNGGSGGSSGDSGSSGSDGSAGQSAQPSPSTATPAT